MERQEAREMLELWIDRKTENELPMDLPVYDEVVMTTPEYDDQGNLKSVSQWSFRGLIKLAYGLEDKPTIIEHFDNKLHRI